MNHVLLWMMVQKVEEAFKLECESLGKEIYERQQETNATLRTAWPLVMKALEGVKNGNKKS